jgi:type IV secretory pathway VirB9-like protein
MRAAIALLLAIASLPTVAPMHAHAMQNDNELAAQEGREWRYRVSGERALRPEQISDDGDKTYLIWAAEQALPAVFAINAVGGEEIVDGYMRDGVFTIDRVYARLVFRIDRKVAKADRLSR